MTIIPKEEIRFNNTSYVDPNTRVFSWNGSIYRAVIPGMKSFYNKLIGEEWFINLQKKGLIVGTEMTNHSLEGFGLVLRHRKIPIITYCMEWPAVLLKKAALLTIRLCIELLEKNLSLQDAYPWNVQFEGVKPIFIDVGSICPFEDERFLWVPYQQFCNFFLFPLYLYSAGIDLPVRFMLLNYLEGITHDACARMLPTSYRFFHPSVFFRLDLPKVMADMVNKLNIEQKLTDSMKTMDKSSFNSARKNMFRGLEKDVESIKLPQKRSAWSDYEQGDPSFTSSDNWSVKQKIVKKILDDYRPESVLDIACNRGWFSILAAMSGASVISFDTDEPSVTSLCADAERKNLNILPLIMNVLNPTPSFGWMLKQFPSAQERISADMTFAFALIHHLVFSQWQNFDRVVETLDVYTKKWLLVEFVPKDDEKSQILLRRKIDTFDWYTLENFLKVLNKKYIKTEIFDSAPSGRKLILCHKR